jgi:DNA-binding response OmpR family regulator
VAEPHQRNRVLIVDDAADDREMYRHFLDAHGYEVGVASDGEAAITRALNGSYDIVVLDIGLPKIDGLEVLRRLRSYASTRQLTVITLSARVGEHARASAVDAGADLALEKPCSPKDLEKAIRVFVERGKRIRGGQGRR